MRYQLLIASAMLALGIATPASGQNTNELLGIPFGGKLQLSQCPFNTDKVTRPCWIDRTTVFKPTGSRSGYAFLPNSESRPKWAANAMFQLTLDHKGIVQEIKVNTFDA